MCDHLLTVVTDDDLIEELPGRNPTLGGLLIEIGDLQGVYTTHSFEASTLDWNHRQLPPPRPGARLGLR